MSRAGLLLVVMLSCVVARAEAVAPLASPCIAGPTSLCLNSGRFKLEVRWTDFEGKTGVGTAVPLTADTGYFWFFSSSNVELVVKVLDARSLNGHFWVFYGALSNVEYTMTVTDTQTGSVKTYSNPSGRFASVGDTAAFAAAGETSPTRTTAFERPYLLPLSTCISTETSLCLNGGRFRAEVNWKDFDGNTGTGKAVALTSDTGYFWFFTSSNVELVVKALDARGLNGRFWVFYGALSNVEYEMTVTDTLTGNVKTYSNPSGRFASAGDTDGFRAGYGVTARLDESRAVSGDIPTTGGTISATASDGSLFTLTIPRDALLSEETITMTPVASIDGLPLSGGLSAAVDLAPAGLRLFQLATLKITPAQAIPLAEQIDFAWRGNGDEFFFYPPELSTQEISMKLIHFSGYGVGRGNAADQAAQKLRVPASPEDALSQRLQDLIAARRRTLWIGPVAASDQSDYFAKVYDELRAYYDTVLAPELAASMHDCVKSQALMIKVLSWTKQALVLGFADSFAQEIGDALPSMIESLVKCYNDAFDKCVNNKDPGQVVNLLSALRQLGMFGAEGQVDQTKVARCTSFRLDFQSVTEEPQFADTRFAWHHDLRATVPLALSLDDGPTGNAELVYLITYNGILDGCTQTSVGTNSVFRVLKTSINLNVFEGKSPPTKPLTVEYDPGNPNLAFTVFCPFVPPQSFPQVQNRWRSTIYDGDHNGEESGSGFLAKDWTMGGGGVYARRSYQITAPYWVETTTITLRHTPQ